VRVTFFHFKSFYPSLFFFLNIGPITESPNDRKTLGSSIYLNQPHQGLTTIANEMDSDFSDLDETIFLEIKNFERNLRVRVSCSSPLPLLSLTL